MLQPQLSSSSSQNIAFITGSDSFPASLVFQVSGSGTWSGSLQPVKRVPGCATLLSASCVNAATQQVVSASIIAPGIFIIDTTGCDVQLAHVWVGGTASIFPNLILK